MDEDADDVDMAEEAGEMEGDLVEELEQEERAGRDKDLVLNNSDC